MKKRLLAWLLALIMVCSLLPMPVSAKDDKEIAPIKAIVTDLVQKQSAAVYQPDAADNAFKAFFKYGFFGLGAKRTFDDSHPMVAALWNTGQLPEAVIEGLTAGIAFMQDFGLDELYLWGGPGWHKFYYDYAYIGYRDDSELFDYRYGQLCSSDDKYGSNNHYQGPRNRNDDLMELMVGGACTNMMIHCTNKTETTAVYTIDMVIEDEFEFVGDYDEIAKKGFNTSGDEQIANLGWLLSHVGLDEFWWEWKKTYTIEVPFHCDHGTGNYRWIYESNPNSIRSVAEDGFSLNEGTHKTYQHINNTDPSKNILRHYFQLDKSITLYHDVPWVIEYDQVGMRYINLSALNTAVSIWPSIQSNYSNYINLYWVESEELPDGQTTPSGAETLYKFYWLGVDLRGKFKHDYSHTYHTTIENVVNSDGSNMMYVTIYDKNLDKVVFGPEPMTYLWYKEEHEETDRLIATDSNRANGIDITIGHIGNKSATLTESGIFDLRIYELGKDAPEDPGTYRAPTCTEQGGMAHHCHKCGLDYFTEAEAALGHDYGEFAEDNNATCTTDGTKTRTCRRCGEADTVTLSGTATGHTYGDYTSDSNATCTTDGTKTRTCDNCGNKETITDAASATGHSFGEYTFNNNATCTTDGTETSTCANCGKTDTRLAQGSAIGHKHIAHLTEPTCTERGYTTFTCDCGDSYTADYTEATGHSMVIDPAVAPTCVSKGLTEGSHCEACGFVEKKQAAISQLKDHTLDEGVIVKEATNTTGGMMLYTCIVCGKESYVFTPALPVPTTKPVVNPFMDVQDTDWFYEPVLWAVGNHITTGKTATTFAPYDGCTRAQVVTFLWAANGKPEPQNMDNPFSDVANDAWYLKPVLWAVENGITGGIGEGKFGPDETCNRAQIATFLWAAKGKHAVSDLTGFSDVTANDWYATPVIWAKENSITDGIGNGMFGPNDPCTRAQVVTFLKKAYE